MSRRTSASSTGTYTSTIDTDRQALVRAWAAEYCGPGQSFTHQGHKIRIRDRMPSKAGPGWFPHAAPLGWADNVTPTYEAVWNKDGAVCLDTPRMAVDDPIVPADPAIEGLIAEHCARPPRCSDQPWFPAQWMAHGDLLTATMP